MKKTKNLIIIGVIIALAVAAGAYFTVGEGYKGMLDIKKQSQEEWDKAHPKPNREVDTPSPESKGQKTPTETEGEAKKEPAETPAA